LATGPLGRTSPTSTIAALLSRSLEAASLLGEEPKILARNLA
jgi:hypothetical protein